LVKNYVRKVRDNSSIMIERLNEELKKGPKDINETENIEENLNIRLEDLQNELIATKRQRVCDYMKNPSQEDILEETYDEIESALIDKINGVKNQLKLNQNRRNTIIQVNRVAKMAIDIFDDILNKDHLDKNDLELIIDTINIYESKVEIQLKADIDSLLRTGDLPEEEAIDKLFTTQVVHKSKQHPEKIITSNVVRNGEISLLRACTKIDNAI